MRNNIKRESIAFAAFITAFIVLLVLLIGYGNKYQNIIPFTGFIIIVSMCVSPVFLNLEK